MLSKKWKISILVFFPILCFSLMAAVLYFYDPTAEPSRNFSYVEGSDAIGIIADKPVAAKIRYDVLIQKAIFAKPQRIFRAVAKLTVTLAGPIAAPIKILVSPDAAVLAKDTRREEDYNGFHAFIVDVSLQPNETKTLSFRYSLEDVVSPYRLRILPGRAKFFCDVSLAFPSDLKLSGREWRMAGSVASWEGACSKAKSLQLYFQENSGSLFLAEAKIVSLDKIYLRFTKRLSKIASEDPLNFSIVDLNKKDSEVTDRIFVKKAEADGESLWLSIAGMTLQRGEHYELVLKDIGDKEGGSLHGQPVKIQLEQFANAI